MKIQKEEWKWIRESQNYKIEEDKIEIITEPHTDLWQRIYYHFRNDYVQLIYQSGYVTHGTNNIY